MTKKQNKKSFIIDLGPLEYKIHVLYLFNDKEIQDYSNKHFDGVKIERNVDAVAEMFPLKNNSCIIDFVTGLSKTNAYNLDTIVHESEHCKLYAFRRLEIHRHGEDNEEFYCYTVGYIFRKIYEGLFQ